MKHSHLVRGGSKTETYQDISRERGPRLTLPHWLVDFVRSIVFTQLVCPATVISPTALPDIQASLTT